jgi:hypothetical protein
MPHSTSKNQKIRKTLEKLNDEIRILSELGEERLKNAEKISLPHVSLGALKKQYKYRHRKVDPALRRQEEKGKFRYLASDSDRYLVIKGWDEGLLACRAPIRDPKVVQTLTTSMNMIPSDKTSKKSKTNGLDRGDHSSQYYCVWADSSPEPFISKDAKLNLETTEKFLDDNKKSWKCMSNLLGEVAPRTYKRFQRFPLPGKLKRFCGAWAGCVVNVGRNKNPVRTKAHRDVKEGKHGYSCLCACGDYEGGEVILYELGVVIELKPGDMLIFPDGLIHHANRPVTGTRYSLVAFTRGNMLAYWEKKFGKGKSKSKPSKSKKIMDRNMKKRRPSKKSK